MGVAHGLDGGPQILHLWGEVEKKTKTADDMRDARRKSRQQRKEQGVAGGGFEKGNLDLSYRHLQPQGIPPPWRAWGALPSSPSESS